MPVSLINSSSTPVVITALSSNSALFTVDGEGTPPLTIAAGSILQMNAHFIPTAKGAASGTITVSSNSLITPTVAVQLSGAGTASSSGTGTSSTGPSLSVNASTVAFGSVAVGTPATQSVVLTSNGGAALVVSGATVTGKGFTVSGVKFPDTLNPGQTATLNVQFDPAASGAATGQVVIASNAANDPSAQVNLTGTGTSGTTPPPSATYQVSLNWTAPSGTVAGYNVYRSPSGSSSYEKLNASVESQADFTDSSVRAGSSYQYYVTSVDNSGDESVPSNVATIAVP
jgi:centrosomal CEP192-like protein